MRTPTDESHGLAREPTGPVVVERRGDVLVITLSRPRVRNAMDGAMIDGLTRAAKRLDGDPTLRVGVLTGADGTFCSGMDLRAFAADELDGDDGGGRTVPWLESPPVTPVVAAVEGWALAGGWELALACDLVVAATDARFGLLEVRRGLVPLGGGLLRLRERLPGPLALELAATGVPIDGTRAHQLGLANRLVAPGAALDGALELAGELAAGAPLAVAAIKRIVGGAGASSDPAARAWARRIGAPVNASEDAREGARAFVERRPPVWKGV